MSRHCHLQLSSAPVSAGKGVFRRIWILPLFFLNSMLVTSPPLQMQSLQHTAWVHRPPSAAPSRSNTLVCTTLVRTVSLYILLHTGVRGTSSNREDRNIILPLIPWCPSCAHVVSLLLLDHPLRTTGWQGCTSQPEFIHAPSLQAKCSEHAATLLPQEEILFVVQMETSLTERWLLKFGGLKTMKQHHLPDSGLSSC